jgi:hypothetical protein
MTDTVKLIIEIPKEKELIDKAIWYDVSDFDTEDLAIILTALKNGVPLDDVKALEQEPCDCISRKSIKHKLQEHHDFFVNAYGGFSNLPQNDKSRVDEILNCIAMVVNEPSIQPKPKTGHWIIKEGREQGYDIAGIKTWYIQIMCDKCGFIKTAIEGHTGQYHFCPNCGAKMESEE